MAMAGTLTEHVRKALSGVEGVREVKMFGGVGFMLHGNMAVAASKRGLLVRVGKEGDGEALKRPGASRMVMAGRTLSGYVRVAGVPFDARTVKGWVARARAHVETLPRKSAAPSRTRAKSTSKAVKGTKRKPGARPR